MSRLVQDDDDELEEGEMQEQWDAFIEEFAKTWGVDPADYPKPDEF